MRKQMKAETIFKRAKKIVNRENFGEYRRIARIVDRVYMNYITLQVAMYRIGEEEGSILADEVMMLSLDILESNPKADEEEIVAIAIHKANIERDWQKINNIYQHPTREAL